MVKIIEKALEGLEKEIGQDKLMVLATRNEEGVSARTVNIYTYEGCFYFVTEAICPVRAAQHFDRYKDDSAMRLIKITPSYASFLSMETGSGYVIDYKKQTAMPIEHKM